MTARSPARVQRFAALGFAPRFAYGEMASAAPVVGGADGTELGAGFVRLVRAHIPWTTRYDEVVLVLEGSLTVALPDRALTAGPWDAIWLPAGTALHYEAEAALVFYAIHPADWAERLQDDR